MTSRFPLPPLLLYSACVACVSGVASGCAERLPQVCDPLVAEKNPGRQIGGPDTDSEELELLGILNRYRAGLGMGRLEISDRLTAAAAWMSQDMSERFYLEHVDSLGRDIGTRLDQFGTGAYVVRAENIANGHASAAQAFEQWRHSPSHDEAMRNPRFSFVGIARAGREGSPCHWYWTTEFGGS